MLPRADYQIRHRLDDVSLVECFRWSEEEYNQRTEGSALRRLGYETLAKKCRRRLGQRPHFRPVREALERRKDHPSALVREHVAWALARHQHNKRLKRLTFHHLRRSDTPR